MVAAPAGVRMAAAPAIARVAAAHAAAADDGLTTTAATEMPPKGNAGVSAHTAGAKAAAEEIGPKPTPAAAMEATAALTVPGENDLVAED